MDTPPSFLPGPAVEAATKLIQILAPLSVEERERAISAAKILLGHSSPDPRGASSLPVPESIPTPSPHGLSSKVDAWMKKHALTSEMLEQVFAFDPTIPAVDIIAAKMPGTSKRQQTVESYVICGLKSFLLTGDPVFSDKDARQVCTKIGCYDGPNHATYLKALDNLVHGSKEAGWRLSNPGLVRAGEIVKQLNSSPS
jgi:hypothetical protein